MCYKPQGGYSSMCLLPQVKEFTLVFGVFVLITHFIQESSFLETSLMMERKI